jgi:hypothetical protein
MRMLTGIWIMLVGAIGMGGARFAAAGERVVLCSDRAGVCQAGKVLGETAQGVWAQVGDDVLLSAHPLPRVLYFSPQQYQDAMTGLADKERGPAIARRNEVVSANLSGVVFGQLVRDLLEAAPGASPTDLDALVAAAVTLDGGIERLRGTAPGELVDLAGGDLAQLLVALPKGPIAEAFAKQAQAVERLTAEIRHDGKPSHLPFAEPKPVFLVPSVPDKELRVLRELGGYPHKWHGGVVAILDQHLLSQAPFKGQDLKQLYPGPTDYLTDLTELTEGQLQQRLATRLQHGFDRPGFVAQQAFRHAILCRSVTVLAQQSRIPWAEKWRGIDIMNIDNLRLAAMPAKAAFDRTRQREQMQRQQLHGNFALAAAILRDSTSSGDRHRAMLAKATDSLARLSPAKD